MNSGPITDVKLTGGARAKRNTQVNVTWKNAYQSPLCETLKVVFCDDQGNPQSILAIAVENRNRDSGSVRVLMPNFNLPAQKWKVRVSSEQKADLYADSEPFNLVP